MKYIETTFKDNYIILNIKINSTQYGVKIKVSNDVDNQTHIEQAKKSISRQIFKVHKIIVNDYEPHLSELFSIPQFFINLTCKKYTKEEVINELINNKTLDYLHLIPDYYFRNKK